MTLLNAAAAVHLGSQTVDAIYGGAVKVWKLSALTLSGTPVTTGTEYEHGVGSSYTSFTVTASSGTPPYTYIATGLPAGITINLTTGVVSGAPGFETAGVHSNIIIQAFDSVGRMGQLAPFAITIDYKDPYYNNVRLLLDYDAPDGEFIFVDQKFGVVGLPKANAKFSVTSAPYGTSAIFTNFNFSNTLDCISFTDDPKWDMGAASFTIDFLARPTNLVSGSSNMWVIGQYGGNTGYSWAAIITSDGSVRFICSTTGSDQLIPIATADGAIIINIWSRWRIDYNGTIYRIYKDGVMLAKTTASHTKAAVAMALSIAANSQLTSNFFTGYLKGLRLTIGNARTASDSGYTISQRPFPSVPYVSPFMAFDPVTAQNVTLTANNQLVTNTATGTSPQGARGADAVGKTTGKYYYEILFMAWPTGGSVGIGGIGTIGSSFANMQNNGTNGVILQSSGGQIWSNGTIPASLTNQIANTRYGFAVDLDNRKFWCKDITHSGLWNDLTLDNPGTNTGGVTIPSGTMVPFCTFGGISTGPGNKVLTNFGSSPFTGAVPAGFTAGWTL